MWIDPLQVRTGHSAIFLFACHLYLSHLNTPKSRTSFVFRSLKLLLIDLNYYFAAIFTATTQYIFPLKYVLHIPCVFDCYIRHLEMWICACLIVFQLLAHGVFMNSKVYKLLSSVHLQVGE